MHLEDHTTQELVEYTLQAVNREYEGQTARILGQQRRRPGEEFERLFRARFRPSDFEQKLGKNIFTIHQCTGESVRDYAERYQTTIVLLASETDPFDGLLNAHRKQWTQGLHAEM